MQEPSSTQLASFGPFPRRFQPAPPPNSLHLFVVDPPLPGSQYGRNAPVAIAPIPYRQIDNPFRQRFVPIRNLLDVPLIGTWLFDCLAHRELQEAEDFLYLVYCLASPGTKIGIQNMVDNDLLGCKICGNLGI